MVKLDDGDSGRYVCVASNAAGTGKFEFEVTVLAHPSLTHEPQTNHTGNSLLPTHHTASMLEQHFYSGDIYVIFVFLKQVFLWITFICSVS